jgi:hypothetical protein
MIGGLKLLLTRGKKKGMASLAMVVCWKIWNKCNAQVFRHQTSPVAIVIAKIKDEARGGGVELSLGILFE